MDYEKKYNNALDWMRKVYPTLNGSAKEDAEHYFSELKESEDERIRKNLIELLLDTPVQDIISHHLELSKVLAYLEKQKEQKVKTDACGFPLREQGESACSYLERCLAPDMRHIWYEACAEIKEKQKEQNIYKSSKSERDFADRYSKDVWEKLMSKFKAVEGYSIGCNDVSDIVLNAILNAFKWQKEQKPTELPKSEDYGIDGLYVAVDILQKTLGEVCGYQTDDGILEHKCAISTVKELYEQKPAEWSADDEAILSWCISDIERAKYSASQTKPELCDIEINWLKSLKPQPRQEWNEEEKEKIDDIIGIICDARECSKIANIGEEKEDNSAFYNELVLFLKSLRPSWKPSAQEKWALRTAIHVFIKERNLPKAAAQLQNILDTFEGKESRKDWKPSKKQMRALERKINNTHYVLGKGKNLNHFTITFKN